MVLAPGERWHYSNLAFILLGEVVARLSGMPYEDYVEARILQPLGLTRTSFAPEPPTAVAYSVEPYRTSCAASRCSSSARAASPRPGSSGRPSATSAAGPSFLASPDPDVLAPESIELMTSVQTMADPVPLVARVGRRPDARAQGRPHLLRARRRHAGLPRERPRRPRRAARRRRARERRRTSSPAEVTLALVDKTRERLAAGDARRGGRGRRRPTSWRARSAAGGRRARSSSSAGTTAGSSARWAEAPAGSRGRVRALDDDRFRTVFGRERGELLRSCATRARHADVLGDVPRPSRNSALIRRRSAHAWRGRG